jgi:hypothetical protein
MTTVSNDPDGDTKLPADNFGSAAWASDEYRSVTPAGRGVTSRGPARIFVATTDDASGGYGYWNHIELKDRREFNAFVDYLRRLADEAFGDARHEISWVDTGLAEVIKCGDMPLHDARFMVHTRGYDDEAAECPVCHRRLWLVVNAIVEEDSAAAAVQDGRA